LLLPFFTHKAPRQEAAVPDNDAWRVALNSLAESPDAETLTEWVDEEPPLEEALPNDLTVTLADLSTREPGNMEYFEANEPDAGASIVDMISQLTDEDAAVLAAKLRSGA